MNDGSIPGKPGPVPVSDGVLLARASAVFAERGFAAATMAELAAGAGVTKPTMYAHFGGKDDLYAACVRYQSEIAQAYLFAAYDTAADFSIDDEIAADMKAFFAYVGEHPEGFALLVGPQPVGAASDRRESLLAAITDRIAVQMAVRVDLDASSPAIRQLAGMTVGASLFAASQLKSDKSADPDTAAVLASVFVTAGIRELHARATMSVGPEFSDRS